MSYRQWQIDFAEKFMKPLYGKAVFAKAFLKRIHEFEELNKITAYKALQLAVVPDCGFQIETDTIEVQENPDDFLLVKIFKDRCAFDSREYVKADKIETIELYNNGFIEEYYDKIELLKERIETKWHS